MHPLAERALRTIRDELRVPHGAGVIAAVSGGSDSVALAHLLTELDAAGDVRLVGLAHLNHQLRGDAAAADETFCRELAVRLSRPIEVERVDVLARARAERRSVEDAGRTARYEFLERARVRAGATYVATGHTRDDQAETFLLRLLRGAGPRGLAGIYPQTGLIIRPLLDMTRDELQEYLSQKKESYRQDESNRDLAIPRNRVRHELLPYLERHFAPNAAAVLARAAAIARDDADWLDRMAAQVASTIVTAEDERILVDAATLRALPLALSRRVARLALERTAGERFIGFDHVAGLLALAAADGHGGLDLPGQRAERSGAWIVLVGQGEARLPDTEDLTRGRWLLAVPGCTRIDPLGIEIAAELETAVERPTDQGAAGNGSTVTISAAEVQGPLAVRTRRPGDRLRPLGLGGHKKIQDLLVDRKVPRPERDRLPLVVDDRDRIVWVVGQALADDFRVTPDTKAVIILRVRRLGRTTG